MRSKDDLLENNCKRLQPGKVSPRLSVPSHIQRPPYVDSRERHGLGNGPEMHDEKGIECMRASGKLTAQVLKYDGTLVKPGTTTDEIDEAVHEMIIENGAYPPPLGYCGYLKSVCTSVNECICHGIPDSRPLGDGDIINIDVTVYLNGYHGDTSATFLCGNVDEKAKKLVQGPCRQIQVWCSLTFCGSWGRKSVSCCSCCASFQKQRWGVYDVGSNIYYRADDNHGEHQSCHMVGQLDGGDGRWKPPRSV